MRYAIVALVVAGNVAAADPMPENVAGWRRPNETGVFIEVGTGFMRENPDGKTYRAEYIRFAPQVAINRWVYVGAALQLAKIYSSSGTLNGELPARCSFGTGPMCVGGSSLVDESSGVIGEPQVFVGVRNRIGIASGSFEAAPTVRWTTASTNYLNESFTTRVATIELHARGDVWATPHLSAGLMVGADFNSVHNFEAGLQIGFHMEPYDLMK